MSKFDALSITSYTRKFAFSQKFPKVKRVDTQEIRSEEDWQTINYVDVFTKRYLPPHSDLLAWRSRLSEIAGAQPYIHTDHGNFSRSGIDDAINLHNAKYIRDCVGQELNWFRFPPKLPRSVSKHSSETSIAKFKSMIFDTPNTQFVDGLSMTPDELSRMAHTRYLSCDHIRWFVKKMNSIQRDTLCVYLDGVTSVEDFVRDSYDAQSNLSIILNVGKLRNGKVFIADDSRPGNHWSFLHYDGSSNKISYGDSLGWKAPDNLNEVIAKWLHSVFNISDPPSIALCHISDSIDNNGRHHLYVKLCSVSTSNMPEYLRCCCCYFNDSQCPVLLVL